MSSHQHLPDHYFADQFEDIEPQQLTQPGSWQQRYQQIHLWGKTLSDKPALQQERFKVEGCATPAWLAHRCHNGRHWFAVQADSKIIRGLAALLMSQLQGQTREAIEQFAIHQHLQDWHLSQHLSPSRSNGFLALYKQACAYTRAD